MKSTLQAAVLAVAITVPAAVAIAQAPPPAASAQDPHHPPGQDSGTPSATGSAAAGTTPAPAAGATSPQMGMMMGNMQQMMQMMQQMMRMMGGAGQGAAPGAMMGGAMPMMGMMSRAPDVGGTATGMVPGGSGPMAGRMGAGGVPGMFLHAEGILAFYKAELHITEAQASAWNAFADAVRASAKALLEATQRAAPQRAAATAPELLDRRIAMLNVQLDASKAVATASKSLYAALTPEQRKLADVFMAEHMHAMRGVMP